MNIQQLTARQAINTIHNAWGSGVHLGPQMLGQLTSIITKAAMIDHDQAAIDWLFLLNWKPQQMVN